MNKDSQPPSDPALASASGSGDYIIALRPAINWHCDSYYAGPAWFMRRNLDGSETYTGGFAHTGRCAARDMNARDAYRASRRLTRLGVPNRIIRQNSEVSGAGATASNDNNESATRQRSLD